MIDRPTRWKERMQQAGWAGACQHQGWYVGVCEKKVKMRLGEQKRDRDLFNREEGGHIVFFFLLRERWQIKESLGRKKVKKGDYRSWLKRKGRKDPINLQPGVNHRRLPVLASLSAKCHSFDLLITALFLNSFLSQQLSLSEVTLMWRMLCKHNKLRGGSGGVEQVEFLRTCRHI